MTRGLVALEEWFAADASRRNIGLAKRLGLESGQAVSQWRHRNARPNDRTRDKLHALLGIEPDHWLTAEEIKARDAELAALREARPSEPTAA